MLTRGRGGRWQTERPVASILLRRLPTMYAGQREATFNMGLPSVTPEPCPPGSGETGLLGPCPSRAGKSSQGHAGLCSKLQLHVHPAWSPRAWVSPLPSEAHPLCCCCYLQSLSRDILPMGPDPDLRQHTQASGHPSACPLGILRDCWAPSLLFRDLLPQEVLPEHSPNPLSGSAPPSSKPCTQLRHLFTRDSDSGEEELHVTHCCPLNTGMAAGLVLTRCLREGSAASRVLNKASLVQPPDLAAARLERLIKAL